MNICRAADAIASFRKNRTHDRLASLALDHWTLRNMGLTPLANHLEINRHPLRLKIYLSIACRNRNYYKI